MTSSEVGPTVIDFRAAVTLKKYKTTKEKMSDFFRHNHVRSSRMVRMGCHLRQVRLLGKSWLRTLHGEKCQIAAKFRRTVPLMVKLMSYFF